MLRLSRAVNETQKAALTPVRKAPSQVGERVISIGHSAGLPAKIAEGGSVLDARGQLRDYFITKEYGATETAAGRPRST